MLTLLAKLLKALNAEGSPAQVSLGFTLGMVVGLTPLWTVSNLFWLLVASVFRINLTAFFLAAVVFSGIAYLFDPSMERLGYWLLNLPALQDLWTAAYNNDLLRLTRFNNTLVLGGLVSGLVLALPFYLLSNFLVKNYRQHLLVWVRKTRLVKLLKASNFYKIYERLSIAGPA